MVRREFGTLTFAVRAAGLTPRPVPRIRAKLRGSEEILNAIREWTSRYGDPPTMADWEPSRARRTGQEWRVARYRRGDWPSARSVRNHFGSLTAAVSAAGLQPRPQGSRQLDLGGWRHQNRALLQERRTAAFTGFGPSDLAKLTRQAAVAARAQDAADLRHVLIDLAASALKWADHLASVPSQGGDGAAAAA